MQKKKLFLTLPQKISIRGKKLARVKAQAKVKAKGVSNISRITVCVCCVCLRRKNTKRRMITTDRHAQHFPKTNLFSIHIKVISLFLCTLGGFGNVGARQNQPKCREIIRLRWCCTNLSECMSRRWSALKSSSDRKKRKSESKSDHRTIPDLIWFHNV